MGQTREAEQACGTDEKLVSKAVDVEDDMQTDINVNVEVHDLGLDESAAQVVYRVSHDLTTSGSEKYMSEENLRTAEQAAGNLPHDDECGTNGYTIADEALVYATISHKNCPHSTVNDATLAAVSKILSSKEHLRSNLKSFEYGNIRNRPMYRGSKHYMHEIEISLKVFKSKLMESARSYLWKNLGTSSWSMIDGTQVTFFKIHKK